VIQARLIRDGSELRHSVEWRVPVVTLKSTPTPPVTKTLTEKSEEVLRLKVEYRVPPVGGEIFITRKVFSLVASSSPRIVETVLITSTNLTGTIDQTIAVATPSGADGSITLQAIYRSRVFKPIVRRHVYFNFGSKPISLVQGSTWESETIGAKLTTLAASATKTLKTAVGRTKVDIQFAVGQKLLEEFAPRSLQSEFPANFTGINRTWFFKTVTNANEPITLEVTLQYELDDLSPAMQQQQGNLKVIAYHAASRQWEIIPARIDVSAKTATFVVNRLADYYSLGIEGAAVAIPSVQVERRGELIVVTSPTVGVLQTTTNLSAPDWRDVSPQAAVAWTNSLSGSQQYFRLRLP
jgi:hypothetical protein